MYFGISCLNLVKEKKRKRKQPLQSSRYNKAQTKSIHSINPFTKYDRSHLLINSIKMDILDQLEINVPNDRNPTLRACNSSSHLKNTARLASL